MKAAVYLFSLWLLVLSGLPCPDADCCHAQKSHLTNTPASSSDDNDHKAPCSPFCSCAICAGFAIPQPFRHLLRAETATAISPQQTFTYQSSGYADVARTVWQPPKV